MDRRTVEHTGAGIAGFIGYLKEVAAGERSALANLANELL